MNTFPSDKPGLTGRLPHILVIDDDPSMREVLSEYLGDNELRVTTLANGREIAAIMERDAVDLVLLDLRLTGGEDGMQIARRLREDSDVPIIMLTARKEAADLVMGLEIGADDFLTKPCSLRELLARIRAVLRRQRLRMRQGRPLGVRAYRFDGWELNLNSRRLRANDGRELALSNTEFNLLVALLGSSERVLSRDELLDLSRLHNDEVFNRAIDVQVMRLRRKIESDPAEPRYIRTERGAGYLFGLPVQTVY
jgi:two-component system, OmpR family, response regulator